MVVSVHNRSEKDFKKHNVTEEMLIDARKREEDEKIRSGDKIVEKEFITKGEKKVNRINLEDDHGLHTKESKGPKMIIK